MTERPNIVLVTVDSLRADHCGFMGYERDTTPTLDRMAQEGMVFENAIAPGPSTPESMPAVFTGTHPANRETSAEGLLARRERIRGHMRARTTLPELLSQQGYTTAAFTPNPFTSRYFGFDEGFDRFEDFMDESYRGTLYRRVFDSFLEGRGVASLARIGMNVLQREEVFKSWESYSEEAIEWTKTATEPYFLWVFLMDAHNPYLPGAAYRSQSRLAQFHANYRFWRESHETPFEESVHESLVIAYDDAVRYSDAFLSRLREELDDPVVVVHGDHGEAFGEHGTYGHEPYLHEENIHVPLVVANRSAGLVRAPISLRSLPDLLGGIASDGEVPTPSRPFVTSRSRMGQRTAIRGRDWKYVQSPAGGITCSLGADEGRDGSGPELETVGQMIVDAVLEDERERARLGAASESGITNDIQDTTHGGD